VRAPIAYLLILIFLAICLLLTGCFGQGRELDETAFILAVGVDTAEDSQLEVSYQLSRETPSPQEGGSGGQSVQGASEIITIKAPSLAEARTLLNSIIAPEPNLAHLKVIVVSEKLARRGLQEIIAPIVRFHEFRGSMFVVISRGPTKDFLKANKPLFAVTPAKYYEEMMGTAGVSSYYPRVQLHNFYLRMKDHSAQTFAPIAAVNTPSGEGAGETPVPGGKVREYVAGSIPRTGGNAIEFAGTAVFSGDKMVGILNTQETRALAILSGKLPHNILTVQDPLMPRMSVAVIVGLLEKPKITATLQDGRPLFDVDIDLEGEISAIGSGINYEQAEYRVLLQQQISTVYEEEIDKFLRKTQELNTDVVGFGYHLRSQFATIDEFHDYNWNDKYRTADIRVHVKTYLRRSGLMRKSSPIIGTSKE
jgi:spore germination protein KC